MLLTGGERAGVLCEGCLARRYGERVSAAQRALGWRCPDCRDISNRAAVREERGWGAMGDSCFADARKAVSSTPKLVPFCCSFTSFSLFLRKQGFASVAHWLVLRRAERALPSDVDECIPARGKRGRPLGGGGEAARRARAVQRGGSAVGPRPLVLMAGKHKTKKRELSLFCFARAHLALCAGVVLELGRVPWERGGASMGFVTPDYLFPAGYRAVSTQCPPPPQKKAIIVFLLLRKRCCSCVCIRWTTGRRVWCWTCASRSATAVRSFARALSTDLRTGTKVREMRRKAKECVVFDAMQRNGFFRALVGAAGVALHQASRAVGSAPHVFGRSHGARRPAHAGNDGVSAGVSQRTQA